MQVRSSNASSQDVSTHVRPLGERVKENTKTASYMGIIVAGIGVTGIMFYAIFRELFSSNSPNSIYSTALEKCKNDPRVQDSLGAPIKGCVSHLPRKSMCF
jgi:mitochondrial import inner membrane translocase subunit TIM21